MGLPVQTDLGEALRQTIDAASIGQVELAKQLRANGWDQVDQSLISKWVTGKRTIPLDVVPLIEDLLGVTRGRLLKLAGFVEPDRSAADAIAADRYLTPRYRDDLATYYEYVRERSTQADR